MKIRNFNFFVQRLARRFLGGVAGGALLFLPDAAVFAQTLPQDAQAGREEIRRRQQQEQAEQKQRIEQPRVGLAPPVKPAPEEIPEDPKGFPVDRVEVDTGGREEFAWLKVPAARYAGRRLGAEGVQHAVRTLSNACIERGFVTTRVLLPEQDIAATRTLRLVVVPGVAGKIVTTPDSSWWGGALWNAFPAYSGKLLNLRDLEQGLEQMKRVPSQDVTMDLKPGARTGESDIVVSRKNKFPVRGHAGVDNSGEKNTGEWQGSATVFWDNPLFLNDLFSFTCNGDIEGASGQGTRGDSIAYSVPFGYLTLHAAYNAYAYHQTVQGIYAPYESSGKSRAFEGRMQLLVHRDQNSKTSAQARVVRRENRGFVDGVELEVQRRETASFELAFLHQRSVGDALLDFSVALRGGMPWFGADGDPVPREKDSPANFYNILTADATARLPFSLGVLRGVATTSLRAQFTEDTLWSGEHFSIGTRYTVRGFDGRRTLGAENGFAWRNECGVALGGSGQQLYAALDYGRVGGRSARYLAGRELLGAAVGLRGGWRWFYYDATVGWPLLKPDALQTADTTFTVQAGVQF
jgi:hemolysin activation/secretion protein